MNTDDEGATIEEDVGCASEFRAYPPRQMWVLMLLPTMKRGWRCIHFVRSVSVML